MNSFDTLLRARNLKVTPQRLGILSIMEKMGHISIEELFTLIKKEFSSISLATLYKNVNSMMEMELVKEVKVPHQKSKYEIVKDAHAHLVCTACGKLEDIKIELNSIVNHAEKQSGYRISEESLILSGICGECRNA